MNKNNTNKSKRYRAILGNPKTFKKVVVDPKDTRYMNHLLSDILGYKVKVVKYLDLNSNINEVNNLIKIVVKNEQGKTKLIILSLNY